MSAMSWLKNNKTAACLGLLSLLLGVAVIVLAVELSNSLSENSGSDEQPTMSPSTTPQPQEPWETDLRIPTEVQPLEYHVTLNPHLSTGVFDGSAKIVFNLTASRDWFPIHVKQLDVKSVTLHDENGKNATISRYPKYEPNEFLVVIPDETLEAGVFTLEIEYAGNLTGKIVGFYESVYLDDSGKSKSIATSKFEPVDARAAFPCFDEPSLKAKFTVSLVRPKAGYSALSNMDQESEKDGPGSEEITVLFKTSVPMSTYLVCFIVSDFESLGAVQVDNSGQKLPVQVFTTPQQTKNSELALNVAKKVTEFYLDYFKIPYPLPKLDLIAIPDFVSGAMEHWGLITFRETALLFDPDTNSASAEKRVASVVAHEIAHQWFGNLVTMAWWDDLWLNEGFASFMESKSLSNIPEYINWAMTEQIVYDALQPVMIADAAINSHPIVQSVDNPDQINQLFDSVSYDKGQAVLRMLEDFLSPEVFQKGLQAYLSTHQFSNAKTENLWSALNAAFDTPELSVNEVMSTWTLQMGYPVVQVRRVDDNVILTQQRFLTDKDLQFDSDQSIYGFKWDIPIKYTTAGHPTSPTSPLWLLRDQDQLTFKIDNATAFVKINYHQVGFYRVNYETDQWQALTKNIMKLDRLDRAHLLNDVFSLASAGYTEYANALDMVKSISAEKDYQPWATALDALYDLDLLLADAAAISDFRSFSLNLVSARYGSLDGQYSWTVPDNDPHLNRLLRVKILGASCYFGMRECLEDVGQYFSDWLADPKKEIPADLRSLVYLYGMVAAGNEANWDKTWEHYMSETNAQERINLLQALAYAQDPKLISKYLEKAWDENNVRSQDYLNVLAYIGATKVGAPVLWDYYRTHWPDLVQRFGLQHRYLGSSILSVTKTFTSEARLTELQEFYAKYPDAGAGEASRKNAEERIATRIKWAARNADSIAKWLEDNKKGSSAI